MRKIIKNAAILTAITLIAGIALGLVYEITKGPIAQAQEEARQAAYRQVIPEAEEFLPYEAFDQEEAAAILQEGQLSGDTLDEVVEALDAEGKVIGYVMTVTSSEAYDGELQLATGIRTDGTVSGISFLSLSETPGLGMRADEDSFKAQFAGKQVSQFRYTKSGASGDDEIDALSGATVTTNAVTNSVNASLLYFQEALGGGTVDE